MFAVYIRRYEDTFREDCMSSTDKEKIILLFLKLAPSENEKFYNFIPSRMPSEIQETVKLQLKMFNDKSFLFNI